MRRRLALGMGLGILAVLGLAAAVPTNVGCGLIWACTYEGRPFRFTVVDAETNQPLADVHALAEWVLEGFHGKDGPLMVQDAVSGADGVLAFPAWGPIPGPASGLVLNQDPGISLFKPGYKTLVLINAYPEGTTETTRVRVFGLGIQRPALVPFRGTPEEWMAELDKATHWSIGRVSEDQIRPFRTPYLNRKRRALAERDGLPRNKKTDAFFSVIERSVRFLEGLGQ